MKQLSLPNPFIALYCDSCLEPLVLVDWETCTVDSKPHVCAYNLTICLNCADFHGLVVSLNLHHIGEIVASKC